MLNIHFLGKARMTFNGDLVYDQLGAKSYALISLLILNENRYMSRDKIIGYLWPDSNDDAARYNLRYNLWLIKKTIQPDEEGNHFLKVDKETCGINEDYAFSSDVCDVIEFSPSDQDTVASMMALKERFEGDFLEGCYFNKCEAFNDLIIFERINFEKRKVKILKRLAELYERENRYEECIETIHEILEIEPYDETFVSKILDVYVLSGKRASAINYYNKFSNQLAGSLGIVPTKELRDKFNELRVKMCGSEKDKQNSQDVEVVVKDTPRVAHGLFIDIIGSRNLTYSGCSEIIDQLMNYCRSQQESSVLGELDPMACYALSTIAPGGLSDVESQWRDKYLGLDVKDIAIVNGLKQLLVLVCATTALTIRVKDQSRVDVFSLEVIQYFEQLSISGLTVDY